jgi:hypothetical protein
VKSKKLEVKSVSLKIPIILKKYFSLRFISLRGYRFARSAARSKDERFAPWNKIGALRGIKEERLRG